MLLRLPVDVLIYWFYRTLVLKRVWNQFRSFHPVCRGIVNRDGGVKLFIKIKGDTKSFCDFVSEKVSIAPNNLRVCEFLFVPILENFNDPLHIIIKKNQPLRELEFHFEVTLNV